MWRFLGGIILSADGRRWGEGRFNRRKVDRIILSVVAPPFRNHSVEHDFVEISPGIILCSPVAAAPRAVLFDSIVLSAEGRRFTQTREPVFCSGGSQSRSFRQYDGRQNDSRRVGVENLLQKEAKRGEGWKRGE
jgi:hypothetical protein